MPSFFLIQKKTTAHVINAPILTIIVNKLGKNLINSLTLFIMFIMSFVFYLS